MPTLKHTHTYVRQRTRKGYYMCADPDCTESTKRGDLHGKRSKCTACGAEMILDNNKLRLSKPTCDLCGGSEKAKTFQKAQALVAGVFKDSTLEPTQSVEYPSISLTDFIADLLGCKDATSKTPKEENSNDMEEIILNDE